MPFAVDDGMDAYTRSCAVQAIGMAGTAEERREAAGTIVARAATLDPQILGAAIETLWPDALSIADIVTILERADPPEAFSSTHLDAQLDRLAERIGSRADRLALLRSVVALLKQTPLHDEYRPISQRYDWLLPPASKLAHSLAAESPVDPAVLSVLAMAARAGHRGGAVTSRHTAQDARRHLLELLLSIPGEPTYVALLELAHFHSTEYARNRMLVLAEQRAELDVEHRAWAEGEVAQFADEAERAPATEAELFRIALSRLDDLKLDLEEGDESEASLLRKAEDEPELRRAIAHRLRQAAHFKYTTGSEEELADKSRTDIRLHNPSIDQRVPIEIKIAGKWSGEHLKERLANQLGEQYLRAARHGIFLVVNRGGEGNRKRWKIGPRSVDFDGLIAALAVEARALLRASTTMEGLEVVGIDLLHRAGPDVRPRETRRRRAGKRTGVKSAGRKERKLSSKRS